MKRLLFFVLGILFFNLSFGQNIYVYTTDGATQTYPLIDVNSITFNENVMNLNLASLDTISWNLSVVDYYNYDQWYVSVEDGFILSEEGITLYPNPTASQFTIKFDLIDETEAVLTLYNLQGSLVSQIFNGHLSSGTQQFDVGSSNLSSIANGTYLVSLQIGNSSFNKLVIVNK